MTAIRIKSEVKSKSWLIHRSELWEYRHGSTNS